MKISGPNVMIRMEDLAVLVCSLAACASFGASWLMFALLFLVPDIFMIGYLRNSAIGAALYNIGHSYLSPLMLAISGWYFGAAILTPIALIWVVHISFDRVIGYGLKYAEGFRSTHIGRL